ncbi:MAG TPA: MFS transporter [Actinomycetota bacterium]|nr:MFS transporter [Actinomycetota bacterium]
MTVHRTSPRAAVRRLAAARLISITGGAAAYTALMFTVYERTRSPAWLSATLVLTFGVNGFLAPIAGAIGDRFDRRRVMIVSDVAGVAAFAAMAFAGDPGWLLAFAFVSAVVETPFWMASAAAIPNMVEPSELSWANSLVSLGRNAGIMVGPAIGGVLVAAIGPAWVFGLNAMTFAVSAILVWTVRAPFEGERSDATEYRGLRAGFVFIARDRVLRTLVLAWTGLVFGFGLVMVADVPLVEHFHAGSIGYGLLITFWGGGSVVGSLAGRYLNEDREPMALFLGTALIAVTTAAIAVSPWFAPILVIALLSGVGDAIVLVAEQGIQQRRTPDAVRSRVIAASEGLTSIAFVLGFAAAGVVLHAVGPRNIYAIGGLTAAIGALVLLPILRRGSEREAVELDVATAEDAEAASAPAMDLT